MTRTFFILLAASVSLPAHAQKAGDVIVMRKVIAPAKRASTVATPPTPTYPGNWSLSSKLTTTTCTAKQRESYYAAICTKPDGSVDATFASCNPSTKPDIQRSTSACTSNCDAFRGGYYYTNSRYIGQISGASESEKQTKARALCENTVPKINSFSCTLSSSVGSNTGSVSISENYSDTFVSGPANYYFTASCRTA